MSVRVMTQLSIKIARMTVPHSSAVSKEPSSGIILRDNKWIQITTDALDLNALVQFVTQPSAGGISIFLGTTRNHIQCN